MFELLQRDAFYRIQFTRFVTIGLHVYYLCSIGVVLIDDQCGPSLTAAMLNHFKAVGLKKLKDDEETGAEVVVSVHQQCLVTRSVPSSSSSVSS